MAKSVQGQVAKLLVAYRTAAGLSQTELAQKIGLQGSGSQVRVSYWERGVYGVSAEPKVLKTLAKLLGLSLDDLNKKIASDERARLPLKKSRGAAKKAAKSAAAEEAPATVDQKAVETYLKGEVALQAAQGVKTLKTEFKNPAKAPPTIPPSLVSGASAPVSERVAELTELLNLPVEIPTKAVAVPPMSNGLSAQEHLAAALLSGEGSDMSPARFVRLAEQYRRLSHALSEQRQLLARPESRL